MPLVATVRESFYVGLDVGKVRDPAALCVLHRRIVLPPPMHFDPARPPELELPSVSYAIRHLERFTLGTAYTQLSERVAAIGEKLWNSPDVGGEVLVDMTGVGRPIFEAVRERLNRRALGVNFTSGRSATAGSSGGLNVPKADLVARLVLMFQSGRLAIADGLRDAPVLVGELVNFRRFLDVETGHASYGNGGESKHDDYVSAAALCAWRAWLPPASLRAQERFL